MSDRADRPIARRKVSVEIDRIALSGIGGAGLGAPLPAEQRPHCWTARYAERHGSWILSGHSFRCCALRKTRGTCAVRMLFHRVLLAQLHHLSLQ